MFLYIHRKIVNTFTSISPVVTLAICAVMLIPLGVLDVATGDYSLIIFYLIPVSIAAWFVSRIGGLFISCLAAVVRLVSDEMVRHDIFTHSILHYWNELIELLFLVIMSLLFAALKNNLENEKNLARRDPLTNALNRRSFFDLAEHELNRAKRYCLPITVAYIDLDNFKLVNDRYGHKVGDELLVSVVDLISSNIRSTDILARFGGDEFVIMLSDASATAAIAFLEKIYESLGNMMSARGWPVSLSIGAVTYQYGPDTVDEIVREADELMYSVKHSGKDRIMHRVFSGDENG